MAHISGLVTDDPPEPNDLNPHYADDDTAPAVDFTMKMSAALGGLARALK